MPDERQDRLLVFGPIDNEWLDELDQENTRFQITKARNWADLPKGTVPDAVLLVSRVDSTTPSISNSQKRLRGLYPGTFIVPARAPLEPGQSAPQEPQGADIFQLKRGDAAMTKELLNTLATGLERHRSSRIMARPGGSS